MMIIAENSRFQSQDERAEKHCALTCIKQTTYDSGAKLSVYPLRGETSSQKESSPLSRPLKKRPMVTSESTPPPKKRCIMVDDILDLVSEEVSEVSEWELILARWNPDLESFPGWVWCGFDWWRVVNELLPQSLYQLMSSWVGRVNTWIASLVTIFHVPCRIPFILKRLCQYLLLT